MRRRDTAPRGSTASADCGPRNREISLDESRSPKNALLGESATAQDRDELVLDNGRYSVADVAAGICDRAAFEASVSYAKERSS